MKCNILMLMGLMILAGCGMSSKGSIFNTEPFVDAKKDAHGNVTLLDTPRMWRDWQDDVNRAIANEAAGRPPGGGIPSWDAQWRRVINANKSRENAPKYIGYIIESRRRAGLPELKDVR